MSDSDNGWDGIYYTDIHPVWYNMDGTEYDPDDRIDEQLAGRNFRNPEEGAEAKIVTVQESFNETVRQMRQKLLADHAATTFYELQAWIDEYGICLEPAEYTSLVALIKRALVGAANI